MNNQKTILHIIDSLGLGGAEKSMVQSVNGIQGFNHIVVILGGPEDLKEKLKNAELINLGTNGLLSRVKAVSGLKKILDEKKVDLVHAQLFNSTLVGRLASRKRLPFIFTLQSMLGEDLFKKNKVARLIERVTYSKSNYLIAVSREALNDYSRYITPGKERTKVIYNSIDASFFAEQYKTFSPGKKVRLVAVGNLKPLKNYEYIFDALRNVPQDLFELDVYGDGPQRTFLQKRVKEENLPVKLMGNVSDLNKRMRDYDIYLHCSKYEGSSLAIFEAMAGGLPVIVSDIPVLHENTGEFATYVNLAEPADLSRKLIDIQKGETEINSAGQKGFDWVKLVAHPSVVFKQTADFYTEILNAS